VAGVQIPSLAVDAVPGNFCFSTGGAQASFSAASASQLTSKDSPIPVAGVDTAGQIMSEANILSDDLRKVLFGNTGSEDNPFPFTISKACPLVATLDDAKDLAALRGFRDNVLSQHTSGIIFTFLFYRNAPELTQLLDQFSELKEKIRMAVTEYSSLIDDVSKGGTAYLSDGDILRIIHLLEEIKTKGSPQLKADIDLVIEEINAGTIVELCGVIIGD
jgi:hypothetical protein